MVAYRDRDIVDAERSIGFTHSHNDDVNWVSEDNLVVLKALVCTLRGPHDLSHSGFQQRVSSSVSPCTAQDTFEEPKEQLAGDD